MIIIAIYNNDRLVKNFIPTKIKVLYKQIIHDIELKIEDNE